MGEAEYLKIGKLECGYMVLPKVRWIYNHTGNKRVVATKMFQIRITGLSIFIGNANGMIGVYDARGRQVRIQTG